MVGGLLSSVGMVSSSFCKSLSQLYLTAGLVTGKYKEQQQNPATALGSVKTGLSTLIFHLAVK